jgi:TPR repeat protein
LFFLSERSEEEKKTKVDSFFELALPHIQNREYDKACFYLQKSIAQNKNPLAMVEYGRLFYSRETNVSRDDKLQAYKWFRAASRFGVPTAYLSLFGHYINSEFFNEQKAFKSISFFSTPSPKFCKSMSQPLRLLKRKREENKEKEEKQEEPPLKKQKTSFGLIFLFFSFFFFLLLFQFSFFGGLKMKWLKPISRKMMYRVSNPSSMIPLSKIFRTSLKKLVLLVPCKSFGFFSLKIVALILPWTSIILSDTQAKTAI